MKFTKATMVLAFVAVAILCFVPASGADGASISGNPNEVTFDNMSGGTISFDVTNDSNGLFEFKVTVTENGKVVLDDGKTYSVPANETREISVKMGDFKSVGTHTLTVTCTPASGFDGFNSFNVTVVVEKNILSDWTTYVVIAIAVIIIAILVYLKIRDVPKNKPTMTFEELEAQRKAEMAEKSEKRSTQKAAASTERKRYSGKKKE